MNEMYDALAPFYDELNSDVDYEAWADYVVKTILRVHPNADKQIVDIGCGTGNVSIPLARRGYYVTGIDLSVEMLNVALERAEAAGVSNMIQLVMQDMTELALPEPVDVVICTLDGLNHLSDRARLMSCIRHVADALTPGGVFIFDVNSQYKFEHIYADEVYTMQTDDAFCVWQNDYHPSGKFCDFWVTLFERGADEKYVRYDTVQREKYFSRKTIENILADAGFKQISVSGDFSGREVAADDERWYYVAVKGN